MTVDSTTTERSISKRKVLAQLQKIADSLGVEGHQRLRKGALIERHPGQVVRGRRGREGWGLEPIER